MSDRLKVHRRQFAWGWRRSWSTNRGRQSRWAKASTCPMRKRYRSRKQRPGRRRVASSWHGVAEQSRAATSGRRDRLVADERRRRTHVDLVGRWVLLGDGILRPDSLFSCYYARDPGSGRLLVSSSPALLHQQVGADAVSLPLVYRVGWSGIRFPLLASPGLGACCRARFSSTPTKNGSSAHDDLSVGRSKERMTRFSAF